ncbi:unnamed protein product [Rotaria socialis]|uniref:Uncharacterized protein n=1 Tax=Rotaria socialis TaxID=392032 RepID=A0A818AAV5_9BILA|nr:unnamed protein product [Rotaria socialis]CAF4789160.1 unnamed protein product [Rotaria socialis]
MESNDTYVYMDESSSHPSLKCKFCIKPLIDPVKTPTGDQFCRKCISRIIRREASNGSDNLNTGGNSPLSNTQKLTPVTEPIVLSMLDALLVRCTACEEINIARGKFNEHKLKHCLKASTLCQAADLKCPWMGTRENLEIHLQECKLEPLRPILEEIFHEHDQVKLRIKNLSEQVKQLTDNTDGEMNLLLQNITVS